MRIRFHRLILIESVRYFYERMHRSYLALLSTLHSMSVPNTSRIQAAGELMKKFATRTGLLESEGDKSRRYLWTDSFAVCNLLGLASCTENLLYKEMCFKLVELVHDHLGRYRSDEKDTSLRRKWISGMTEEIGLNHPTIAGLRIGKPLPERTVLEPYNEQLEWERDGQYFHYLTKWMVALNQVALYEKNTTWNTEAIELATAATNAFVKPDGKGGYFMYWKMSTDLSRPLVSSMGSHDPEDGYVTLTRLLMTYEFLHNKDNCDDELINQLRDQANRMKSMIKISPTTDPLGLGGMFIDAYHLYIAHNAGHDSLKIVDQILKQALIGIRFFADSKQLKAAAHDRLAFRELGLAIGLRSIDILKLLHSEKSLGHTSHLLKDISLTLEALNKFLPLADIIESFWLDPRHQKERTWMHHLDINEVMLATCLCPTGFLCHNVRSNI